MVTSLVISSLYSALILFILTAHLRHYQKKESILSLSELVLDMIFCFFLFFFLYVKTHTTVCMMDSLSGSLHNILQHCDNASLNLLYSHKIHTNYVFEFIMTSNFSSCCFLKSIKNALYCNSILLHNISP